jgi:hypothetical protein
VLDFSRIEADHVAVARQAFRVGDAVAAPSPSSRRRRGPTGST